MDESVLVRALTIGASVLITLATITVVLMYYNTAKQGASGIGRGQDLEKSYRSDIEHALLKNNITGIELKNILNYFYNNKDVNITINSVKILDNTGIVKIFSNITENVNTPINKSSYDNLMKNIVPNQLMKLEKGNNSKYVISLI